MHDDQERKMRELVYRLIEMAPEAPPFQEADMVELENHAVPARPTNRRTLVFVASLAAALVIGIAAPIIVFRNDPSSPPTTQPPATSTAPLASTWVYTSVNDGETQTMTVRISGDGAVEIVVRDDLAPACAGTPSTMTGTGRIEAGTQFVIPAPMYTCDNGSEPEAEQLRDWTLSLDTQSDTLTDSGGGVWVRGLAPLWPQTSLEEVRQAQELANAGDSRYTWQRGGARWWQPWQNHPNDSEIFARFLEEELGWEGFLWAHHQFLHHEFAHHEGVVSGDVVYIRCAPGLTNPLYLTDPEGSGCAPTIDELRYETVKINVAQLASESPGGIWVVTGWEMIEPFEQIAPPTDAEVTALLEAFFQARIDGEGAEEFADVSEDDPFASERVDREIPLLYATSTGASYERAEFELVDGPVWPSGEMQLEVRLFAENDATVVEQLFFLERDETGGLRLVHDFQPMGREGPLPATTENGEAVPVEYRFLDGEVSYRAAYPFKPADYQLFVDGDYYAWDRRPERTAIAGLPFVDRRALPLLLLLADPRPIGPDCVEAPAPVDAAALAQSIRSDPDFEATPPVAVTIGGIPTLQIDLLVKQNANWCWRPSDGEASHHALFKDTPVADDQLVRLYLLDLPGASDRVLAIVLFNADLEQALEFAAPIVDSIEFHTR
jgi:hypothetical protein